MRQRITGPVKTKEAECVFFEALRDGRGRDNIARLTRDFSDGDWRGLTGLAVSNSLFPPFYAGISAFELDNVPPEVLSDWKYLYIRNLRRNILLENELLAILNRFKEAGIPAMPLKGPCLARYLYNDLAGRQTSSDLDILVRGESLRHAEKVLNGLGYSFKFGEKVRAGLYKFGKAMQFSKEGLQSKSVSLDLHWRLRDRFFGANLETFWSDAGELDVNGFKVSVPSPEDLLLYLSLISIFDDSFVMIKYLYDFHRLFGGPHKKTDRAILLEKALRFDLTAPLFFSFALSGEFFRTRVPDELLKTIRPPAFKRNLCRIWLNRANILRNRAKLGHSYIWMNFVMCCIHSRSTADCARRVREKMFIPMEEAFALRGVPPYKIAYFIWLAARLLGIKTKYLRPAKKWLERILSVACGLL